MAWTISTLLTRITNIVLAVITFFLGARIILRLLDANAATPFVGWIYRVSESLMYPFTGIFPDFQLAPGSTIDVVAIVALIAYALIGYIIVSVINSIFHTAEDTYVHPEHRHI
jgi:uncharacterized protein YggT (Ycf19 family)